MAEADWDSVTYIGKRPAKSGALKSQKVLVFTERSDNS